MFIGIWDLDGMGAYADGYWDCVWEWDTDTKVEMKGEERILRFILVDGISISSDILVMRFVEMNL